MCKAYWLCSKWICCKSEQPSLLGLLKARCMRKVYERGQQYGTIQEDGQTSQTVPLCSSRALLSTVVTLHNVSKVVLLLSNIVYFGYVCYPNDKLSDPRQQQADIQQQQQQQQGQLFAYYITYSACIYEIIVIVGTPFHLMVLDCLCSHWDINSNFFSYLRMNDLLFVIQAAPFANAYLHYVGGYFWLFIMARLFYYSMTFVSSVVAGFKFFFNFLCIKCIEFTCCGNGEAVEIRDYKHLFREVSFQVFSITVNLLTGSSALSTYLKIAVIQRDPLRYAYLAFTLLSCFNAIAATFYNAVLLRWVVMKEDHKNDNSIGSMILEFLKFNTPSSHVTFVIGFIIQSGLIGLNSYILYSGNLQATVNEHYCFH